MVISDRRFAAEMRGGEKNIVFKFDDIGCAVFWLRDKAKDFPGWPSRPPDSGSPTPRQGRQMAGCAQGALQRRRCRRWATTSVGAAEVSPFAEAGQP
jgi:hypothetical protein